MRVDIPIYDIQSLKSYKNEGILVSRFGYYVQEHQHLNSAHRHTFYHLVLFTEGSGTQTIDFKTLEVKPGLIYFMVPGQVHSWDFESEPDGFIINFSADYFSSMLLQPDYLSNFSFFNGKPDAQVFELSGNLQRLISSIFEDILKEGQIEKPINDDLVKTLLLRLLITIERTTDITHSNINTTYNQTLLKNFQKLIETNYTRLRLPKQYAELLYITPNHLNAVCNDLLGISAGTLIRDRILLEAKRLLINVDLLVAEIADRLNFADQSYFIKFFKKYEGTTPEKFRKLNTTHHGHK